MIIAARITAPKAMPTLAPVERPLAADVGLGEAEVVSRGGAEVVGLEVAMDDTDDEVEVVLETGAFALMLK